MPLAPPAAAAQWGGGGAEPAGCGRGDGGGGKVRYEGCGMEAEASASLSGKDGLNRRCATSAIERRVRADGLDCGRDGDGGWEGDGGMPVKRAGNPEPANISSLRTR